MKTIEIRTLIAIVIMLIASSCKTESISPIQLQLAQYSLTKTDLPSGWSFEGKNWGTDFGGESYAISYQADTHVFITHTVAIYSGKDDAKQAYSQWESKWFRLTKLQPDIPFSPSSQSDNYRYECGRLQPDYPLTFCFYLQQHNTIINFVKINLDDSSKNNLTFAQVNNILSILDKRLSNVAIDTTTPATLSP